MGFRMLNPDVLTRPGGRFPFAKRSRTGWLRQRSLRPHKVPPAYVKVEVNPRARGRTAVFELTDPQLGFATSKVKNIAFVGGYSTGKLQALSARAISLGLLNKGLFMGVYARTNKDLRLVIMLQIKSIPNWLKIKLKSNPTDMTVELIGYQAAVLPANSVMM